MRLGRRSLSMPRGDGHIVQQHCLSTRRRMTDCGREHRGLYRPLLARVPAGAGTFGASSTDRRSTPEHSLPVPSLATNGVLTPLSFVITALTHFHPRRMNALAFLIRLSVHESRADALLANQICNLAVRKPRASESAPHERLSAPRRLPSSDACHCAAMKLAGVLDTEHAPRQPMVARQTRHLLPASAGQLFFLFSRCPRGRPNPRRTQVTGLAALGAVA